MGQLSSLEAPGPGNQLGGDNLGRECDQPRRARSTPYDSSTPVDMLNCGAVWRQV